MTDNPGISIFMRFADCVPIFLVDPVKRAIGMAHAGWVGQRRTGSSSVAVQAMTRQYQCRQEDILAGIGPSIGVEHYPVGEDVVSQVKQLLSN